MSTTRVKLTDEDRLETCLIAIRGGDPRKHLEQLGSSDPQGTWSKVKAWCADKKPEVYAKIPKRIAVTDEAPVVKLSGPIVIETPDGKETKVGTVCDALNNMADAAADFFSKCEEMGLNLEDKKITQPVSYDGMVIREVEGLFGRYRRSDIGGKIYIDFEPTESLDVLSYTVEQWKTFRQEQEKAAAVLGVEL